VHWQKNLWLALSFAAAVRKRGMDEFTSEGLPPDLEAIGTRMSAERPVATDVALDRVMTRAKRAIVTPKRSLLWRSTAPRLPRRSISLAVVAALACGGVASTASAGLLSPLTTQATVIVNAAATLVGTTATTTNTVTLNAPAVQYQCDNPITVAVVGTLLDDPLALLVKANPLLNIATVRVVGKTQVGPIVNVSYCVVVA